MPAKDPAKVDILLQRLEHLKSPQAKQELVVLMAETAMAQVNYGFRTSTSPDGFTWPALKSRPGGKPLQDTRRNLQASISPRFGSGRFRLVTPFIGAKVHQYGATIVPVRAKALRFGVRGAAPARGRRGPTSIVFAQKVVIPQRQYLPIGPNLPDRWREAFQETHRRFMSRLLKGGGTP